MAIHETAIISPQAEIHEDATVGPFCVVKGKVKIGAGTVLESHVSVGNEHGIVEIGERNIIMPGACVGGPPQDLKYNGEPTKLIIGHENEIRECATLNTGTPGGGGVTSIGNKNLLMSYVHIAHDCILDDDIVIANSCQLAGHVIIEKSVKVGGVCCFNQFVRLGEYAYIAGDSTVNKDIPPYSIAQGKYAVTRATNKIGMERAGFEKSQIESVHKAIRYITKGKETIEEALEKVSQECESSRPLEHLVSFVKSSERGIAK